MNTGGPTWPTEVVETTENQKTTSDISVIDQTRYIGKYCRKISQKPHIKEKSKEFLQWRISKDAFRREFEQSLLELPESVRRSMGIESDTLQSLRKFLETTGCFDDIFLYEIEHNKKLKDQSRVEMLDSCVESADEEFELTDGNKEALKEYLSHVKERTMITFMESHRTKKQIIKKAIKSEQLNTKLFLLNNINAIHNKIMNLDPTRSDTKRLQSVWSTLLGWFHTHPGEDVLTAFKRIQEEGTEGDMSADYALLFGPANTCMSEKDKDTILSYLVRNLVPTVSFDEIASMDSRAAKQMIDAHSEISQETITTDSERKSALIQYRGETSRALRSNSMIWLRVPTKNLDRSLRIKVLWTLWSKRRVTNLKNFYAGRPGSIWNSSVVEFEDAFQAAYDIKPEEVMTHEDLHVKLQSRLWDRLKNTDKFVPGNIMMWRKKGEKWQRDVVGYYAVDEILGDENVDGDGEIRVRFLGSNTSVDPHNVLWDGRLSHGWISFSYTGPQFFDKLMGTDDDVTIDFMEGIQENGTEHEKFAEQLRNDQVRFYTDKEAHAELRNKFWDTEIGSVATLNEELDSLVNTDKAKEMESTQPEKRKLYPGMIFALQNFENPEDTTTFQIEEIIEWENGELGKILVWDGSWEGEWARREWTFLEFINFIKHIQGNGVVYRIPGGAPNKPMSVEQFNMLMGSEKHNSEWAYKKNKNVMIQDGKLMQYSASGSASEQTIVGVGDGKDLQIHSIDGDMIEISYWTFKDGKIDKNNKIKPASFTGSSTQTVSLAIFWEYLQKNSGYELKKPTEVFQKKWKDEKPSMGWWNIFKHSHSLGVLLHGDLWKAPFKAWEEQHHKDHDFHGKLTAALAIEKLQSGGLTRGIMDWSEWPSLMVADSNNSFQSYLDELVNKVEGMGSYHRTRLIKKWGKSEHFPAAKFMAAMFASMKIFSQLYPYDSDDGDYEDKHGHTQWYWYNSIVHSLGKYPHMPPHKGEDWPKECQNKEWEPLTEIEMCYKVFSNFDHPILKNLWRRFQKYMNNGHDELIDGGKWNLEQRVNMTERLDWMMWTALNSKPSELFGAATEMYLTEGYDTWISTAPYAAFLFGHREEQILPKTQTYAKDLFQSGTQMPMLVFCQNKALGDTFRETAIAFAYSMGKGIWDELQSLCNIWAHRLHGKSQGADFRKRFLKFWKDNGTTLMHKLTGMRDPMLNLMVNAPDTFEEMLEAMPEWSKKNEYAELKKRKRHITGYVDRLKSTYDSPWHVEIPRNKAFYGGDQFRFRKSFNVGYPIAWLNWDAYLDANLDKNYAAGSAFTDGDGIFNEIRGFLYAIPEMAEKMVDEMGIKNVQKKQELIDKICKKLYHKNIESMKSVATGKIKATNPEAEYCSMTAMMFGIVPIQELSFGGSNPEAQSRYKDYFDKMKVMDERAKSIENSGKMNEAIKYRAEAAQKWSNIVKSQVNTKKYSVEDIENGTWKNEANAVQKLTEETVTVFEKKMTLEGKNNIVQFSKETEDNIVDFSQNNITGQQNKKAA